MTVSISSEGRPRRQRVSALSPDDRRAALIAAIIPLLREYGPRVSTRQIADAAGVAEGTIFGVFADKSSLIRAAVISAFDPAPVVRALGEISRESERGHRADDPGPVLRRVQLRWRLVAATELLGGRIVDNAPLIEAARGCSAGAEDGWPPAELLAARQAILDALVAVIEPDRVLLRRSPATAARMLLSMVFASGRGGFGEVEALDSDELVSLLLDGILVPPLPHQETRPRPDTGESPC